MKFGVYPAYIGGRDVTGDNPHLVHTVSARALLEDTFPNLRLKRDLDLGTVDAQAADARVVGACVVADEAMTMAAVESAAEAAPRWRRVPLADRVEIGYRISERIRQHQEPLVELLIAEGTPRTMAEGMMAGLPHTSWSRETIEWCASQLEFRRQDGAREMIL